MASEYLFVHNESYRFDTGPSLLLLPSVYNESFAFLGKKMEDFIKLSSVTPLYRCFFQEYESSNNPSDSLLSNSPNFLDIESSYKGFEKFLPGSSKDIKRYMDISNSFLNFGLPNVIEERLELKYLLQFVIACLKIFPLLPHSFMLSQLFKSKAIRGSVTLILYLYIADIFNRYSCNVVPKFVRWIIAI